MRQHFRPYTLVKHSANIKTTAITADLVDSSGTALACNYVSMTLSGTVNGHVRMAADFPGLATPLANFESPIDAIGSTDGSGVPSVYTTGGGEAATLVLSDKDRVSSVKIQGDEAEEVIAIITYGQISVGSNLRDQERPVGD